MAPTWSALHASSARMSARRRLSVGGSLSSRPGVMSLQWISKREKPHLQLGHVMWRSAFSQRYWGRSAGAIVAGSSGSRTASPVPHLPQIAGALSHRPGWQAQPYPSCRGLWAPSASAHSAPGAPSPGMHSPWVQQLQAGQERSCSMSRLKCGSISGQYLEQVGRA